MKKITKKITIDFQEYLNATGFLYKLSKQSATNFDFSCILEKDITLNKKQQLKKQFGSIPTILNAICLNFTAGFKLPKIRNDIEVTRNFQKLTWSAKMVKSKKEIKKMEERQQELVDDVIESLKEDFKSGDYTVLEELLKFIPMKNLVQSLEEEKWSKYSEIKLD